MEQRVRRLTPVVAVVVALLLLGWIAASIDLSPEATPIPEIEPFPDDASASPSDEATAGFDVADGLAPEPKEIPSWIGSAIVAIVTILLAALGALLLTLLVRAARRRRPPDSGDDDRPAARRVSAEELREAVRAGLSDIDAGGDPRAAVIDCWLRLERAAANADSARLAADTPDDLVRRLLGRHSIDDTALSRLAETYRRARYAPHPVTVADRDDARAALAAVDTALAARAKETT